MSSRGRAGRRARTLLLAVLTVALVAPLPAVRAALDTDTGSTGGFRAGAASVRATWHVGASAGQYASDGTPIHDGAFDPSAHSTRRAPTQGIESDAFVRALVVEGADGTRSALVTNDLYIPQALLRARVVTILEDRDAEIAAGLATGTPTGIDDSNLMISVSHSHSSPYYSTPSWGVWAFQDVFDLRYFEWIATQMADAVVAATGDLRPATMGAHRVPFDLGQRHSFGPTVADDGTPAGYPETDNDKVVEVVAFDDVETGAAIGTWVVFGLHPEMLDGNDLHTGEYVGLMQTVVERSGGGVTLFSQNNVGSSEPARDGRAHEPEARAEYSHKEYAQMTRIGALLADSVLDARQDIADGVSVVAPSDDVPVAISTRWYAPPGARALPTVSSCRAEQAFAGNPGVPLVGLPDCAFPVRQAQGFGAPAMPFDLRVTYDLLRQAGVPVPDNTGAPSLTGLQETAAVPLQALRLGTVGITICPCEQWADQSRNIKTRLDRLDDNLWLGFDWTEQTVVRAGQPRDWCVQHADTTWTCGNPRNNGATDLAPVTDLAYRRMVAQVRNDAKGWDEPGNELASESDPADPADIWGNYTHEELTDDDSFDGYDLVLTPAMANDYWGYIATYREFQRGDHYRKALTGLGPHSSDFLATRLSRMAASLAGFDGFDGEDSVLRRTAKDDAYEAAEPPRLEEVARAIGRIARAATPAYAASLPADGGTPSITEQPASIQRFDAARVSWVGGSNWFDVPEARVERLESGQWLPYGDLRSEVQVKIDYPDLPEAAAWRTSSYEWTWTATFEAAVSDISLPDAAGTARTATPAGTYRFVIDGVRHEGLGVVTPYSLTSNPFDVDVWRGITVSNLSVDGSTVRFDVGPRTNAFSDPAYVVGPIDYPDSYVSPFAFIDTVRTLHTYDLADKTRHQQFCFHCSFEPRADAGDAVSATVSLRMSPTGPSVAIAASCGGGVCTATLPDGGHSVVVGPGTVFDAHGNTNAIGTEVLL